MYMADNVLVRHSEHNWSLVQSDYRSPVRLGAMGVAMLFYRGNSVQNFLCKLDGNPLILLERGTLKLEEWLSLRVSSSILKYRRCTLVNSGNFLPSLKFDILLCVFCFSKHFNWEKNSKLFFLDMGYSEYLPIFYPWIDFNVTNSLSLASFITADCQQLGKFQILTNYSCIHYAL